MKSYLQAVLLAAATSMVPVHSAQFTITPVRIFMSPKDRAVAVIRERRGTAFAPDIVDCLCAEAVALLPAFDAPSVWDDVLCAEPLPGATLT